MKKTKIALFICLVLVVGATFAILPGCKTEAAQETTAPETVVVTETVVVKETVEVEKESPYTYEKLREMAKAGAYEGEPAKGHTMAFANIIKSFPFCTSVENNIIEEWQLAGGSMDDLTVLDNAADTALAIQNADIIFNKKPEVFLQFQLDAQVNAQIGRRAEELGVFIIAIDVPVPGFPFQGVDNYGTSVLTGNWAADQIDAVYGGWENVDRVFFLWNPVIGETVAMRIYGSMDVFKERFGDEADTKVEGSKAVLVDAGSTTDEAKAAFADILAAYPEDENIMVFCLNDQTSAGVQAAADIAGRWDPDKWMIMSQGLDDLGMQLVRDGIVDGDSAYFPEKYGEYLIPGAVAYMYGNPVPAYMFIENVIITPENIDEYYPQ
ncbi:MAG: sugar ABC transporter substrate-binding protein [Actinobacteria bacterium]|nr:sugar ABC transporter substrate-binding protein [Actinomycetota bacterium]